jgi:hypothetical protein
MREICHANSSSRARGQQRLSIFSTVAVHLRAQKGKCALFVRLLRIIA